MKKPSALTALFASPGWSLLQTALAVLGLLYALLAAMLWWAADARARVGLQYRVPLPDQIAATLEAMDDAGPDERRLLLRALNGADYQVTLLAAWPAENTPGRGSQRWLALTVMGFLPAEKQALGEHLTITYRLVSEAPLVARDVKILTRLSDGVVVQITSQNSALPHFFALWSVAVLGIIGAALIVGAMAGIQRVFAPLHAVAKAADRIGLAAQAEPLPETGPKELRVVARAFNAMQKRLAHIIAQRTRMLAGIAHDLRTLLTRQRLRMERLVDPEMRRKAIADFEFMLRVIDTHLDFAKAEALDEPKTVFDLAELVRDLCEDAAIGGASARYQGPDRLALLGMPAALRRAIGNLIGNALEYGGQADVSLAAGEGVVTLRVADRGPGVAAALREAVFEPYFRNGQGGDGADQTGHLGLGLAIARAVARRHGGDIRIEDREGGGAVFCMSLPAQGPA